MGLFNRNPEKSAAIAAHKAAKAELHDNQTAEQTAGIDHETPEYLRLNHEANATAQNVSWWRR